jgi:hypothetical protein
MKKSIIILIAMIIVTQANAQLSLSGDIRTLAEFRQGYRRMPNLNETPAGQVAQRTRLIFGFSQDRITTHISFHDTRIWGQQQPLTSNAPSLDLHEAWVRIAIDKDWFAKIGRQEIRYDNQRFFAINDWHPVGQKHDALLFGYKNNTSEMHVGAAFNQSSDRTFGTLYYMNNYKTLNYIWYKRPIFPSLTISLLGVSDGFEHPENPRMLYVRTTGSAYLDFNSDGLFSLRLNPALQRGKSPRGQSIRASYFMAEVSAKPSGKFLTTLGIEWYSGNDFNTPDDGTYRAFEALYGAGHTAHGYMDYFLNVPSHTMGGGLINPYLKNSLALGNKLRFDADLHLFYLQKEYRNWSTTSDKFLGTEVDLTLGYQFNPIANLSFGYSMMFGTETMEIIKGGNKDAHAHWAYVMLRIRPRFL